MGRGLLVLCGMLLFWANGASAAYYYAGDGSYFVATNVAPVSVRRATAEGADIAFFTPVAGFQRPGFQCIPLVEITRVGGKPSRRQGTACRALNAR